MLSSQSFGQDLLLNGGFEGLATGNLSTITTPWSTSNTAAPFPAISATGSRSGSNNLLLPNDFVPFRQSFTAVAGTTYTLTLYTLFTNATLPSGTDGIFVSIRDDTGGNGTAFIPNRVFYITPTALADGYIKYTYTFEATQTNLLLYIFKNTRAIGTNPNNAVRIDDVSIVAGATAAVTVTGTAPYNYTYDGTRKAPTFSSTETITYAYSGGGISGTQALGPINVASNYLALAKVPEGSGFAYLAIPFTVDKATPSITPVVGTYTYTGSAQGPNTVTTASPGTVTYSYSGVSLSYGPSATSPTLAGDYTVTATVAATANYNLASSSATAFTINKAAPTVTPNIGIYSYNGSAQGPNTVTTASTGTVTYSYSGVIPIYGPSATRPILAGSYTVTASITSDANYNAGSSTATAFAIAKAPLSITANTTTIVYKALYTIGIGSTDFTSSGLQNGETIGSITMGSSGYAGDIGTYISYPSAATGGTFTATNYTITYTSGNLTVNPKIGDYRTKATGLWSVLTTWERWNGSAWVEPTTLEGYPGRFTSPYVVYIENSHHITGDRTVTGANRIVEMIFSNGPVSSSLSISGTNSLVVNNSVNVRSGADRTINVGIGFLSCGSINMLDTGSDSIDSKITVSTGAIFVFNSVTMSGSSERNAIEFTGNGVLKIDNGTMTGGTIIPLTGTVYYTNDGNQAVGDYDYTNLVLEGSGIKTVPADVTISSNLTIRGTASASLFTGIEYFIGTLTLGCLGREDGTWGSSGPDPDPQHVDEDYFEFKTGFINVAINTRPSLVTTQTPATCITAGIITVTPVSGATSYTLTGTSPVVAAVTNASGVFSGLSVGTYSAYFTNPCGTSSTLTGIVISGLVTKTWNGTTWSPAGNPTDNNQNIIFTGDYAEATDVSACECTVNSGIVNFPTGNYLKLGGKLTVNTPGTLTFENNASLVQTTFTGANTGDITYKRNYSGGELDYTYWSSPVVGQNLLAVSPAANSNKFYTFDPGSNDWVKETPSSTTMTIGKGYIFTGAPLPAATGTFVGVPNNGNQSIAVAGGETSNLIGNPYPSAIDADTFLSANAAAIDGTLYFWTHNTAIQDRDLIALDPFTGLTTAGSGKLAYTSNDYAVYNLTGGVVINGVTFVQGGTVAVSAGVQPTGKIAAGQSFFTTSTTAGGTVNFTNEMRVDGLGIPNNNSNFFRTKKPKTTKAIEKNRVWLNMSNDQGAFKQTLVGYITAATNDYDSRFDGESYDGNDFVDFYSVNNNKNLTIQARALPFDENDEVSLGYRTSINGKFTINIAQVDGLLTNKSVFLEDKLTNTVFDLKGGNYTFSTVAGTFNDRFVLKFSSKTLSLDEVVTNDGINILYSNKLKTVIIRNYVDDTIVNSVTLYNLTGQKIGNWVVKDKEQTNIQIPINKLPSEIYIVKVKTNLGESSKKISIN